MERDSFIYKARRKIQVVAHKLFSNEFMSKLHFKIVLKEKLDLKNPRTFNEKLQWLKLYYYPQNDLAVKCADKYRVREYIKDKEYENTLVPLLGAWDNVEDIDWDSLPNKFVLKCNHGCAYNIVCNDKTEFDRIKAKKQLNTWLKEDFGAFNIEPHYSNIKKHKITCEEFLGDNLVDYKFFCFNGKPEYLYVLADRKVGDKAGLGVFKADTYEKLNVVRCDEKPLERVVEKPQVYDKMYEIAQILSRPFPESRIDLYCIDNKVYFGEITFFDGSGYMKFDPDEFDFTMGDKFILPERNN